MSDLYSHRSGSRGPPVAQPTPVRPAVGPRNSFANKFDRFIDKYDINKGKDYPDPEDYEDTAKFGRSRQRSRSARRDSSSRRDLSNAAHWGASSTDSSNSPPSVFSGRTPTSSKSSSSTADLAFSVVAGFAGAYMAYKGFKAVGSDRSQTKSPMVSALLDQDSQPQRLKSPRPDRDYDSDGEREFHKASFAATKTRHREEVQYIQRIMSPAPFASPIPFERPTSTDGLASGVDGRERKGPFLPPPHTRTPAISAGEEAQKRARQWALEESEELHQSRERHDRALSRGSTHSTERHRSRSLREYEHDGGVRVKDPSPSRRTRSERLEGSSSSRQAPRRDSRDPHYGFDAESKSPRRRSDPERHSSRSSDRQSSSRRSATPGGRGDVEKGSDRDRGERPSLKTISSYATPPGEDRSRGDRPILKKSSTYPDPRSVTASSNSSRSASRGRRTVSISEPSRVERAQMLLQLIPPSWRSSQTREEAEAVAAAANAEASEERIRGLRRVESSTTNIEHSTESLRAHLRSTTARCSTCRSWTAQTAFRRTTYSRAEHPSGIGRCRTFTSTSGLVRPTCDAVRFTSLGSFVMRMWC